MMKEVNMPTCRDEEQILSWVENAVGIDIFRANTVHAMKVVLAGNDKRSVLAVLRQCYPFMNVVVGQHGSSIFVRPPRIQRQLDRTDEPKFESTILYQLDLVVMKQLAMMRKDLAGVLAYATEEKWTRRAGMNRDMRGVAGEVLLDALVEASLPNIRKELSGALIHSITDVDEHDRSSLEYDINDLLRSHYRFCLEPNGCFLFAGSRMMREYEHALIVDGDDGFALLLLDAATGSTSGKLGKMITMKDCAIQNDAQHCVHSISIAFDAYYDTHPHKLILPFAEGVNSLVASRKTK